MLGEVTRISLIEWIWWLSTAGGKYFGIFHRLALFEVRKFSWKVWQPWVTVELQANMIYCVIFLWWVAHLLALSVCSCCENSPQECFCETSVSRRGFGLRWGLGRMEKVWQPRSGSGVFRFRLGIGLVRIPGSPYPCLAVTKLTTSPESENNSHLIRCANIATLLTTKHWRSAR